MTSTGALGPDDPDEISGYLLRGRLGAGGMGVVYLSHTRGGRPVALKVIRRELAADPEFRRRFSREVEAARRVQGPCTAAVLDSRTDGERPWLATAYVPGPTLAEALHAHGPLPAPTVLLLAVGAARALRAVHEAGVVHRDLKPSNVLLAPDGPRVIDFGVSRAADATVLTGTDVRLGTPCYMSPEQAEGLPTGPAVDVFSLGLLLYLAATGRHPFGEGSGPEMLFRIVGRRPDLADCPAPLRDVVGRCLAKDPDERPSPAQVADACRPPAARAGVSLEGGGGWWLPRPLARRVAEHARTPVAAGPSPATQPPPRPARSAPAYPLPEQGPDPVVPPPGGRVRRRVRRRVRAAAGLVAAALLGAAGALGAVHLAGHDPFAPARHGAPEVAGR